MEYPARVKRTAWLLPPVLLALLAWLPGLNWGLPTRQADATLFGGRPPWSGAELLALLPADDPTASRGADVDATPLAPATQPVLLNGTDSQRAAIVRRYRLQSRQPDEFINFKSIADMARRGDFDPRLYQYGGLWLYPLAATLKVASLAALIDLRGDMAFYLDHPDTFGRFYVVARLVSVAWGLVGVVSVCWVARRLTDNRLLGALAGMGFALLPIVVNAAHEAKPHLAGTALMLLSVIPATRFVERGRWHDAILAGLTAGAAAAMVVSAVLGLAVLPAMALLRRDTARRRSIALLLSLACAAVLFGAANPFVLYNALARPELLSSNLGNSTAMYAVGFAGLARALHLLAMGGTVVLLVVAVVGLVAMAIRPLPRGRGSSSSGNATILLLAGPTLLVLTQFVLLAGGKPAEYVRFALLPLATSVIVAVVGVDRLVVNPRWSACLSSLLVGFITVLGSMETARFVRSSSSGEDASLGATLSNPGSVMALAYEPAPWSCPPVDLFRTELWLVPRGRDWLARAGQGTTQLGPANLASQFGVRDPRETFNWAANQWFVRSTTTPGLNSGR